MGPGIEVGHGVHDAATELAELRPAADHALLLQRAGRQAQVVGGFVVGQVALRLGGRGDGSGSGSTRFGPHGVDLHRSGKPGHYTKPDGGTVKTVMRSAQGRFEASAARPSATRWTFARGR